MYVHPTQDASDQIVIGESSILVLEGEKEDLMEQLEQMKKENQTISSDLNTASGEKGGALEELEVRGILFLFNFILIYNVYLSIFVSINYFIYLFIQSFIYLCSCLSIYSLINFIKISNRF